MTKVHQKNQQVSLLPTSLRLIIVLLLVLFTSCKEIRYECIEMPDLIVVADEDTIKNTQYYKAKMYLSDTTFFRIKETKTRIIPFMLCNNAKVEMSGDTGIISFKVGTEDTSLYKVDFWDASITFPSNRGGDITIAKKIKYTIVK